MSPVPPTNLGGRPPLPWTASRNRKLARLWLLTDISIAEIKKVFEELDRAEFTPSTRSISTQIGLLLPNNGKHWREYRPKGVPQMKNRLHQLKHARSQLKSKYSNRHARQQADARATHEELSDTFVEHIPAGVPSHIFLPRSNLPGYSFTFAKSGQTWQEGSLDDSRFSNKEVVVADTQETCSRPVSGSVQEIQMDSEVSLPYGNPPLALEAQPTTASPSRDLNETQSQLSRLRSTSILRKSSSAGFQIVRNSVSSKLSRSLSHVESVISATNSWRSSLIYAMSSASRRSQNSAHVNLTRKEYMTWNELVDESKFDSIDQMPNRPSDYQAISLDCFSCPACLFSRRHEIARSSPLTDGDLLNLDRPDSLDRFGNTPLHHAAAAGNYPGVFKLMSLLDAETPPRNTSGETYMHVLGIAREMVFSEFLHILNTAAKQGFDFLSPDYSGNTAARRLHETVLSWKLELDPLDICKRLSTVFNVPVSTLIPTNPQRSNSSAGSLHPKSSQNELDENGNTKLIAVLKDWKQNPIPSPLLLELIESSNVHMRDRRGYTALELTVGNGLEEAVKLLLSCGANPNTRSYRGTSVLAHATVRLAQAQEEGKGSLYAQILSCIALLADVGGKTLVNVFDEYAVPTPIRDHSERMSGITRWVAVKCLPSHERFLGWVLLLRNKSPNILPIERRTCPLIGCEECFVDSDAMLAHVTTCPSLSRGFYRCFESGQSQRIGRCETLGCSMFYQGKFAAVVNALERRLKPKYHPLLASVIHELNKAKSMSDELALCPGGVTELDGIENGIEYSLLPELPGSIISDIGQSSENPLPNLEESQGLGLEMDWSAPTGFSTTITGVSDLTFSAMDLLPPRPSTPERNTIWNGQIHRNNQLHPTTVPLASIIESLEPVAHVPYSCSPILPSASTSGFIHPATLIPNNNSMIDFVEGPSSYWQDTTFPECFRDAAINSSTIPLQLNDPGPTFAREHIKPDIDYLARQRHSLAVKRNAQLMCMHCQRTFNDKSNLKRHGITCKRNTSLNSNKRYRCTYPHCEASYTRSDNLEVHQRRKKHQQDGS